MQNLSKRRIVLNISEQIDHIIQTDITKIVQITLDTIADALAEGRTVEMRNFGVFEIQAVKPRRGRNPRKPTNEVVIPARAKVRFTAGKELNERVLLLTDEKMKERDQHTNSRRK